MDTLSPGVDCVSGRRMLWTLTDCLVCRGLWRRPRDYQDAVVALNAAPALMTGRQDVTSNNFFFCHNSLFVCNWLNYRMVIGNGHHETTRLNVQFMHHSAFFGMWLLNWVLAHTHLASVEEEQQEQEQEEEEMWLWWSGLIHLKSQTCQSCDTNEPQAKNDSFREYLLLTIIYNFHVDWNAGSYFLLISNQWCASRQERGKLEVILCPFVFLFALEGFSGVWIVSVCVWVCACVRACCHRHSCSAK